MRRDTKLNRRARRSMFPMFCFEETPKETDCLTEISFHNARRLVNKREKQKREKQRAKS